MDFKAVFQGIAVTVGAAIILGPLGYLATLLMAPDPQTVRGEIEWIDVPNPVSGRIIEKTPDTEKVLSNIFGMSGVSRFLDKQSWRSASFRIAKVQLTNSGEIRSKPIEFSAPEFAVFSNKAVEGNGAIQSEITLKPIDQNETTLVFMIGSSSYNDPTVKIIHDNRAVTPKTLSNRDNMMALRLASEFPTTMPLLMLIGAATILAAILILVVSAAIRIVMGHKFEFEAKYADPKQIKKKLDFIEYVRQHYPEKLATPAETKTTAA